jgi:hypothetical protein
MAESRTIKHSFKTESTTRNAGCRNHCVARGTRDQAFDRALNYSTTAPLPLRPTFAADARLQCICTIPAPGVCPGSFSVLPRAQPGWIAVEKLKPRMARILSRKPDSAKHRAP